MALQQDYHQFSATDMPEVRNIRSIMLKSLRLREKMSVPRLDSITKAIITDLNVNKLCPDISNWYQESRECTEVLRDVERTLKKARDELHETLWHIMDIQCSRYEKLAKSKASSKEILTAATDMATKYYSRSKSAKKSKKSASKKPDQPATSSANSPTKKNNQNTVPTQSKAPTTKSSSPKPSSQVSTAPNKRPRHSQPEDTHSTPNSSVFTFSFASPFDFNQINQSPSTTNFNTPTTTKEPSRKTTHSRASTPASRKQPNRNVKQLI